MKIIVHSNPLGASPEFYKLHRGVIAGCFGSQIWYYTSRWNWTTREEDAEVLEQAEAEQVLIDARIRYEHLTSYQPIKIEFTIIQR
jgi:hypothetical protein